MSSPSSMPFGPQAVSPKLVMLGAWLEGLMYGVYFPLFCGSLWVLLSRRVWQHVNVHLVATSCIMFGLVTAHTFLNLVSWLGNPSHDAHKSAELARATSIYQALVLVADSLIIYRCWSIWNRSYFVAAAPAVLSLANAGLGWANCFAPTSFNFNNHVTSTMQLRLNLVPILSISTHVVATSLIAGRIIYTSRRMRFTRSQRAQSKTFRGVLILLVESAAIYTAALSVQCVFFFRAPLANVAYLGMLAPISAIVPTLIILRVGIMSFEPARCTDTTNAHSIVLTVTKPDESLFASEP